MHSPLRTVQIPLAAAAFALLGACGGNSAVKSATPANPPAPAHCVALPAQGKKPDLPCLPGGVVPSKLTVKDVKVGTGPAAAAGEQLTVDYRGALYLGGEFDNSYDAAQPFPPFALGAGNVIAGWDEGLVGMKAGGKRLLFIPPDKGYGPGGNGPIPPNATLRFVVELRSIG